MSSKSHCKKIKKKSYYQKYNWPNPLTFGKHDVQLIKRSVKTNEKKLLHLLKNNNILISDINLIIKNYLFEVINCSFKTSFIDDDDMNDLSADIIYKGKTYEFDFCSYDDSNKFHNSVTLEIIDDRKLLFCTNNKYTVNKLFYRRIKNEIIDKNELCILYDVVNIFDIIFNDYKKSRLIGMIIE